MGAAILWREMKLRANLDFHYIYLLTIFLVTFRVLYKMWACVNETIISLVQIYVLESPNLLLLNIH